MAEGRSHSGAPPDLLAGFDAGQTHTTCRLAAVQPGGGWRVLAEGQGPGVSHLEAAGGEERFSHALRASLQAALGAAGLGATGPGTGGSAATTPLAAAGVGASGIEHGSAVQQRGQELAAAALQLPAERVLVTGDERTALRGAFAGDGPAGAGIVVISGTGCIALGRDGRGREHRCGGWGWLLDQGGSACDLGRDALALALEMADGRRPGTGLRPALWQALAGESGVVTAQQVKAMVVAPAFGAAGFARLAPCVEALAAAGDADALAVLQRSADALAGLVRGVAAALALEQPRVCGQGGALVHLPTFAAAYRQALAAGLPGAALVEAAGDACDGALSLAAEQLAGL
ncbi:N-acetylglucosamine kinase [Synechococcus sp. ATX 2A4]|uniref:BadF/BadG/BcrA/BcrD ATPase family protein n=1 Tax=Synechococcus sp. ATX 2A4 TaxID=2823727 RepID=UPI0020CF9C86|nr:BadF/BadG/BcrA/BcrD ATPase family protein [Synechococcus sp. ATX 2A4]MCP9886183.1 N-acetylglucosamine kinase [Synechococcus sp. ATX 2A4]